MEAKINLGKQIENIVDSAEEKSSRLAGCHDWHNKSNVNTARRVPTGKAGKRTGKLNLGQDEK